MAPGRRPPWDMSAFSIDRDQYTRYRRKIEALRRERRDHGLRARHDRKIMTAYREHVQAIQEARKVIATRRSQGLDSTHELLSLQAEAMLAVVSLAPSFLAAQERIAESLVYLNAQLTRLHEDIHVQSVRDTDEVDHG